MFYICNNDYIINIGSRGLLPYGPYRRHDMCTTILIMFELVLFLPLCPKNWCFAPTIFNLNARRRETPIIKLNSTKNNSPLITFYYFGNHQQGEVSEPLSPQEQAIQHTCNIVNSRPRKLSSCNGKRFFFFIFNFLLVQGRQEYYSRFP